jgi:putative transcriptional regulator
MDYSKLIKRIRETLLLSQEELAGKLGVSFATINRWENGHNIPTMKARRKIRDFCGRHKIEYF